MKKSKDQQNATRNEGRNRELIRIENTKGSSHRNQEQGKQAKGGHLIPEDEWKVVCPN